MRFYDEGKYARGARKWLKEWRTSLEIIYFVFFLLTTPRAIEPSVAVGHVLLPDLPDKSQVRGFEVSISSHVLPLLFIALPIVRTRRTDDLARSARSRSEAGFGLVGTSTAVGRMRCRRRALSLGVVHAEAARVREHMGNHLPRRAVRGKITESGANIMQEAGLAAALLLSERAPTVRASEELVLLSLITSAQGDWVRTGGDSKQPVKGYNGDRLKGGQAGERKLTGRDWLMAVRRPGIRVFNAPAHSH